MPCRRDRYILIVLFNFKSLRLNEPTTMTVKAHSCYVTRSNKQLHVISLEPTVSVQLY